MAYRCRKNQAEECDGCGNCTPQQPAETGVIITAMIEMRFKVYGGIETAIREGDKDKARAFAEDYVENNIECCGIVSDDMTVKEIEYELDK